MSSSSMFVPSSTAAQWAATTVGASEDPDGGPADFVKASTCAWLQCASGVPPIGLQGFDAVLGPHASDLLAESHISTSEHVLWEQSWHGIIDMLLA